MTSILQCTNTNQLATFITHMIPKIWSGSISMSTSRSNAFKSFCQNILNSTQISTPCILVALYYIYQLRFAYPSIKASIGSEVRLLTTSLMLANKFLDDNTFTNKTWSEVSSVPLHELNIMEREFLSALQYRTRVHHVQFFTWASQCQYWMSQLLNTTHRKSSRHNHPYYHPNHPVISQQKHFFEPVLSWSSSTSYMIPSYHYPTAASVATVAAATALNVNYSNFISPQ